MKVYVDDVVVRLDSLEQHVRNLEEVFAAIRKYNMRLNPDKCVFGVTSENFLRFMLTHIGIEANPYKCRAVMVMRSPANVREAQRLIGKLTVLSGFMPKLAKKVHPMLRLVKKAKKFV